MTRRFYRKGFRPSTKLSTPPHLQVRYALPDASARFDEADTILRDELSEAALSPSPLEACLAPGRLEELTRARSTLEGCAAALRGHIEGKKRAFPRLCFMCNEEVLGMLCKGWNPVALDLELAHVTAVVRGIIWQVGTTGGTKGSPCARTQ